MSKFIEKVHESLTGNVSVPWRPLKIYKKQLDKTTEDQFLMPDYLHEYKIGVEWIVIVSCEKKHLNNIIKNVVRELREVIYGDIKTRIINLERAVYEHDYDKILMETRDIIREVFDTP